MAALAEAHARTAARFVPSGRSGINPVTFCELAWHGVRVRGPEAVDVDLWADLDALRAFTVDNLRTYWRPWGQQKRPVPRDRRHRAGSASSPKA